MTIRNISEYSDTEYDVCIVGSGPAGITLASELLDSDKKVCVLESGGETKTPHADSLKRVINLGEVKIRKESRERIFGGTSTTWGGGSSPLDGVDMILRDFMVHPSGWPFEVDFLSPYYKRCEKYGFPSLKMFENENFKDVRDVCDFSLNSDVLEEKIFISVDPPWNFGHKFKHIFLNKNIDLYTDATAYNLRLAEQDAGKGQSVVGLDVVSSHGKKINVRAKQYVVACGGIESTRLLMVSKDISKIEGLRNNLGRYLMNHPKNSYGILKLNKPISSLPMYFGFLKNGVAGYAGLRIKQNSQIVQRILNSYVRMEPVFPWSDNQGVWSFLTIVKKFKFFLNAWKKSQKKIVHLRDYNETPDDSNKTLEHKSSFSWFRAIFDIIMNINMVLTYSYYRLFASKKIFIDRVRLRNYMEMEPCYENYMSLSNETDKNDIKLPVVNINTTELDRRSLIKLHESLRSEFLKLNIGKLEGEIENENIWPINTDASHHLGGTRMGISPYNSVVDSNLRVFGTDNLYVCSGSVFPTSGCANPTYTICALAIRLADSIKKL